MDLPKSLYKPSVCPQYATIGDLVIAKCKQKGLSPHRVAKMIDFDSAGMHRMLKEGRGCNLNAFIKILKVLDNITMEELKTIPPNPKSYKK